MCLRSNAPFYVATYNIEWIFLDVWYAPRFSIPGISGLSWADKSWVETGVIVKETSSAPLESRLGIIIYMPGSAKNRRNAVFRQIRYFLLYIKQWVRIKTFGCNIQLYLNDLLLFSIINRQGASRIKIIKYLEPIFRDMLSVQQKSTI